jgi:hypothetical protein
MAATLDLDRASREELIALVVRQREQIADLEQRVVRQEAELAALRATITQVTERLGVLLAEHDPTEPGSSAHSPTMPGLKPAPRQPPPPRPPRKRRAQGYGRPRMRPTARQGHAFPPCPQCGTPLRGGTHRHRREVIEVVAAPVPIIEHVSVERRCPRCRGRWQPGPALTGVVVGQGRLGIGLLSLIAVLRDELRLPVRSIQYSLDAVHGLRLRVGAIVDALHLVADRAAPLMQHLGEAIRASPVLHVDETGWRQDGTNGYAWTFSTERERLFVRGGRDRPVLEQAIGTDYAGVLVSDFYAAYTSYAGRHQ